MIVSDLESHWQLVRQPDHAALCRAFAERWGNREFQPPVTLQSLVVASERHDDGWAVWERAPSRDPKTDKPLNFLDIAVPVHLAFWRAAAAAVSLQDPYAGILVSLHGAGIYRGRYGMQPDLKMTLADEVRDQVDVFVSERETAYSEFLQRYQVKDTEVWGSYRYLQVFDMLSLYFSGQAVGNLRHREPGTLTRVPTDYGGTTAEIAIEPLGEDIYRFSPYPFDGSDNTFTLVRRRLEKQAWDTDDAFRAEVRGLPVEQVRLSIVA